MISVQKCVAHPWMCDVLGHLTTRFYVGMFDDASYHLLHAVFGWTGASDDTPVPDKVLVTSTFENTKAMSDL